MDIAISLYFFIFLMVPYETYTWGMDTGTEKKGP